MKSVYLILLSIFCLLHVSGFSALEISLTVSAEKRLLEVVWYNASYIPGDRVVVTNQQPKYTQGWSSDVVAEVFVTSANGWVATNISFDYELLGNLNTSTEGCYGYWICYLDRNDDLKAVNCLKTYARWMNHLRPGIETLRLADLFIVGTHDSGSYSDGRPEGFVGKYSHTQYDDIMGQLINGARYLDIRPAYYNFLPGKPFYVNHGLIRQRPMDEIIQQVKAFIQQTKEFVIFGMKEFPLGFTEMSVHEKFVAYLKKEFEGVYVNPQMTWNASLGDLWSNDQHVILAYDDWSVVQNFGEILFPGVIQRWGNVQTWNALQNFLRSLYYRKGNFLVPCSDMAELTADVAGILKDKYGGLKRMADDVNGRVSMLYRNELAEQANIVSVDYFRGTTLVELGLTVNKNKIRQNYVRANPHLW